MHYLFLIFLSISGLKFSNAQTTKTRFFKDSELKKEVSPSKAVFKQTTTHDGDSTSIILVRLSDNAIVGKEIYKNEEPVGIWIYLKNNQTLTADYNFQLIYSNERCDSLSSILSLHKDIDSIEYQSPKIHKNVPLAPTMYKIFGASFVQASIRNDISGNVLIRFIINENGDVSDIRVLKGTHIIFDKEAVRLVRLLSFSEPPILYNRPISSCYLLPFSFDYQ